MSARERIGSFLLALAWVGFLWILTQQGGAVGIARSDDWSYLLTQFDFAQSGEILMNNWAVTMLVGQTLSAAPVVWIFGDSVAALQAFVAVFAVLALVMTYVVIRAVLPPVWAFFSVALLAMSPIFGPSAVSFMTDVPALFFLSLALWCGVRGLRRGEAPRWSMLIASALFSVIAFTFRDYALLAFAPVAVVAFMRARDNRTRLQVSSLVFVVLALAVVLYAWRHSLPNDLRLEGWSLDYSVTLVARALLTLSLLTVPALFALRWKKIRLPGRWPNVILVLSGLIASGVVLWVAGFELLGNVIHPYASTWLISGPGIRLWPLWFNRFLIVSAAVALALLLVFILVAVSGRTSRPWWRGTVAWVRDRPADAIVALFPLIILAAHVGATVLLGTWFIDRYFILFLAFFAAAIFLMAKSRDWLASGKRLVAAFVALGAYALFGIHVTDFDARFDGARWMLGERLVSQGLAPEEIDAGMQWVSFHATSIGLGAQEVPVREGRPWWTERYPQQLICATAFAQEGQSAADSDAVLDVENVRTLFGREFSLIAIPGPDACGSNGG